MARRYYLMLRSADTRVSKHAQQLSNSPFIALCLPVALGAGQGQLALLQVVVGGAHARALAELEGILAAVELVDDAAVLAHLDAVDLAALQEHRVLAGELLGDALDRLAHAEGLAAADALEGLVLVQRHRAHRRVGEVDARLQGDDL